LLIKYDSMEKYGVVEAQTNLFLTSVLYEDEWSASRCSHFATEERALGISWTG
jgi:hypothetical protein